MVGGAQDWPSSSDQATAGEARCPDWLRRGWLLAAFGATQQAAAASCRQCVSDGAGPSGPWEDLRQRVLLGSEGFVANVRQPLPEGRDLSEIPRRQRRAPAKPLPDYARLHPEPDNAIRAACTSGGGTLTSRLEGENFVQMRQVSRRRCALQAKGRGPSAEGQIRATGMYRPLALGAWPTRRNVPV